ncbi:MAG: chromosome partitioning protein ParB [Chloroflexi bacterium]|nr:MAG: chromosome partitioning protein ParB [Chloroflexota bacterium]
MWVRLPAHTPPVESRGPRSYMAAAKKTPRKAPTKATRSRRPAAARGPEPRDSIVDPSSDNVSDLVAQVQRHGGTVVGAYRDPFAGQTLVLASLPLKKVAATPFQRDLSKTHATRLLDPVIAVPSRDGFWSPNGRHRLEAARRLGVRSVTALLVPDEKMAFRILALNTEKAHNLRDRSLEVIRMARQLAKEQPRSKESEHAITFDSPVFMTLGPAYEQRSRFAGSSYQSVLNKVDRFLDSTLPAALRQREQWAVRIMDIDDRVAAHVKAMQAMGMKSPYLRAVVVARINPVRFVPPSRKKDAAPPMSMAEALTKMAANVRKFDPKSVRPGDLALVAAIAPAES